MKKLIGDWEPSEKTLAWCKANGFDAGAHLEFFRDYCEANEVKYANFDAAFRNCCRSDWGGVRKNAKPRPVVPVVSPVVKVVSEEQAAENRKRIAEMMKQMTRGA